MKIFILLMFLITWPDINFQPKVKLIASPEAAAIMLWDYNDGGCTYTAELYCVDIGNGTVTELQIPEIEFGYQADPEPGYGKDYELKFE